VQAAAVRLPERLRASPETVGSILVTAPSGERLPLSQLADIKVEEGPGRIMREPLARMIWRLGISSGTADSSAASCRPLRAAAMARIAVAAPHDTACESSRTISTDEFSSVPMLAVSSNRR